MSTKQKPKQNFPFQCQTKANMVRRGKSIERNFYIDFSTKQPSDKSSFLDSEKENKFANENEVYSNEYNGVSSKNNINDLDLRYRNFRKDRLNYNNYLLTKNGSITSNLFSASASTSGSRSSSVKNKAQIPTLPQNISSNKPKNSNRIQKQANKNATKRRNHKNKQTDSILSENSTENYYESDYNSSLDYLMSEYDFPNYDYDYDYESYSEIPHNAIIRFVNSESNLYNISEISELNTQSSIHSHKSQHHHQKQTKRTDDRTHARRKPKPNQQLQTQLNSNRRSKIHATNQKKSILQPKFCMTEDLTESFLDDLTDHPRKEDEEDSSIPKSINEISSKIRSAPLNTRPQLKISSSIHIFVNNPSIQHIKCKIMPSEVYMHVPPPNYDQTYNESSISQYTNDENDLTISAISFTNFGSPSPIQAKTNRTSNQIKRINIESTESEEINTPKIKSRNINYNQIINNQKMNAKRTNPSKQQTEQKANSSRFTINSNQEKRSTQEPTQKSQQNKTQTVNQSQTKKLIQSLFSNQENSNSLLTDEQPPTPSSNHVTIPSTNPSSNTLKTNSSFQNFIQQNNEIINDLSQNNNQIPIEQSNEHDITNSQNGNENLEFGSAIKVVNLLNSVVDLSNNKSLSNISLVNKNSYSGTESDQKGSQNNILLSDSYDETLGLDVKTVSNTNNSNKNHEVLFDEETTYNTTMSSIIDREGSSNATDEIILEEIRGYFDESSSHGNTYVTNNQNNNNNNNNNNNDKINQNSNSNISFSSMANDDFLED